MDMLLIEWKPLHKQESKRMNIWWVITCFRAYMFGSHRQCYGNLTVATALSGKVNSHLEPGGHAHWAHCLPPSPQLCLHLWMRWPVTDEKSAGWRD